MRTSAIMPFPLPRSKAHILRLPFELQPLAHIVIVTVMNKQKQKHQAFLTSAPPQTSCAPVHLCNSITTIERIKFFIFPAGPGQRSPGLVSGNHLEQGRVGLPEADSGLTE